MLRGFPTSSTSEAVTAEDLGRRRMVIVAEEPESAKPKLLDQMRDVLRRRHYSYRTEHTYVDWVRRYILFHGKRHPRDMRETEITAFLSWLARQGKVAASTQNQALSALLFLYKEVLKLELGRLDSVERAKQPAKLRWYSRSGRWAKFCPSCTVRTS